MLSGDYDMALLSRNHLFDVADPISYLTADYTCGGGYNLSHYCNKDLDAKVKEAGSTVDSAERYALYAEIAKELKDKAVSVWLVHEQRVDAVSKKVVNFHTHPHQHYALTKDISIVSKGAAAK
jgi:peptide/nickel transport system substrate-binding protein